MQDRGLTYADSGVDIAAGEALVRRIGAAARASARPGVVGGLGGFGALFDLAQTGFRDPILVAATDGVGTKLKVAIEAGRLEGLGQDLVAMCVNDLACHGAEPLFFLDYFATARLEVEDAATIIEGIARACTLSGCALVGGETAEMPGLYRPGEFDLAGFAVGAVERDALLPVEVQIGDVLIGLGSSGLHANGFSLVRHVVAAEGLDWASAAPFGPPLAEAALAPTRIYVGAIRAAQALPGLRAAAHITGGGLTENLPRVLSEGRGAEIDLGNWSRPQIFEWLRATGGIAEGEMLRTFNCGIGMVFVVAPDAAPAQVEALRAAGETAAPIGRVVAGSGVHYVGMW